MLGWNQLDPFLPDLESLRAAEPRRRVPATLPSAHSPGVGGLGIALHAGHAGLLGEPAGDQDLKGIVAAAVEPDIDGESRAARSALRTDCVR